MFISEDSFTNSCSVSAFLVFVFVIWPVLIGKFLCLYNKTEFGFGIYILSVVLEMLILIPVSEYLDRRAEKNENEEE